MNSLQEEFQYQIGTSSDRFISNFPAHRALFALDIVFNEGLNARVSETIGAHRIFGSAIESGLFFFPISLR
jgi:hypothetical protein